MIYYYIYNEYKNKIGSSKKGNSNALIVPIITVIVSVIAFIITFFNHIICREVNILINLGLLLLVIILAVVFKTDEQKNNSEVDYRKKRKDCIDKLKDLLLDEKYNLYTLQGIEMLMEKSKEKTSNFSLIKHLSKVPVIIASVVTGFGFPSNLETLTNISQNINAILLLAITVALIYVLFKMTVDNIEFIVLRIHFRLFDDLCFLKVTMMPSDDNITAHTENSNLDAT